MRPRLMKKQKKKHNDTKYMNIALVSLLLTVIGYFLNVAISIEQTATCLKKTKTQFESSWVAWNMNMKVLSDKPVGIIPVQSYKYKTVLMLWILLKLSFRSQLTVTYSMLTIGTLNTPMQNPVKHLWRNFFAKIGNTF